MEEILQVYWALCYAHGQSECLSLERPCSGGGFGRRKCLMRTSPCWTGAASGPSRLVGPHPRTHCCHRLLTEVAHFVTMVSLSRAGPLGQPSTQDTQAGRGADGCPDPAHEAACHRPGRQLHLKGTPSSQTTAGVRERHWALVVLPSCSRSLLLVQLLIDVSGCGINRWQQRWRTWKGSRKSCLHSRGCG